MSFDAVVVCDEVVGFAVGEVVAAQHTIKPSPVFECSLFHDIRIDSSDGTATPLGPTVPEYGSPSTVRWSQQDSVSNSVLYGTVAASTSTSQASSSPCCVLTPSVTQLVPSTSR